MNNPVVQFSFVSDAASELYDGFWERTRDADAAIDLRSTEQFRLYPGQTRLIGLGIKINIVDDSMAAIILPRSGLGCKGLVLGNLVGLIDCGYQGELKMMAWNRHDTESDIDAHTIEIDKGERIAQLVFIPVLRPNLRHVQSFALSARGEAGMGSSGTR